MNFQDFLSQVYIWPTVTIYDFLYVILFFVAMFLLYRVVDMYYLHQIRIRQIWTRLIELSMRKGLTQKELKVLEEFFWGLSDLKKRNLANIDLKEGFRSLLIDAFGSSAKVTEMHIKVLDKLFYENEEIDKEIASMEDVRIGEICGVELSDNQYILGTIMKVNGQELLISMRDSLPDKSLINQMINVYIFRVGLGGFNLIGKVQKASANNLVFLLTDGIEMKGNEHLMAVIRISLVITQWLAIKPNQEKLPLELPFETGGEQKIIYGYTEKISDRAIVFNVTDSIYREMIQFDDLWEISFTLTSGYEFNCKGRIIPTGSHFIFKFIDATDEARNQIFDEIRKNNPKRENLG